MITDWLTGVRIASTILWLLLAFRILFYSWNITDQPAPLRKRAWDYWRVSQVLLCAIVAFIFSPTSILLVNGYITQGLAFHLQLFGSLGSCVVAVLSLVAIDISGGKSSRGGFGYAAIILVSVIYALTVNLL